MGKNNKQITIEIVRKRLGKRGKIMTEKQIEDLLTFLRLLCNKTIDYVIQRN